MQAFAGTWEAAISVWLCCGPIKWCVLRLHCLWLSCNLDYTDKHSAKPPVYELTHTHMLMASDSQCFKHDILRRCLPTLTDQRRSIADGYTTTVKVQTKRKASKYYAALSVGWRSALSVHTCRNLTRCSAIAERPRCRVRYSFRQK